MLFRSLRWAQAAGGVCHRGPVVRTGDDHRAADGASAWRSAFIEAPYLQTNLVSLGVLADTFETVCTWARFPELHRAVVGTMVEEMRRLCGSGRISCRFTHVYPDGPAPYYTFLCPVRAGSEVETWSRLKQAATDALRREGGSITHHHAIGRIHRPWYAEQVPKLHQQALRAVRSTLDPQGIMNPGVLLPPEA